MNQQEVIKIIERLAEKEGSLRALARKWEVSAAYLSDIMLQKRLPGPKVLKCMNLVGKKQVVRTFEARRKQQ